MRRTIALTALLVCCCGTSAAGDIEITAMYGYRWGGEIDADQSPLFTEDVEIDDGAAYGLALGFRPLGALIIELSANVQQSRFTDSDSLFGDSTELFDVDTAFYQVGVGGCWTLADGAGAEPEHDGAGQRGDPRLQDDVAAVAAVCHSAREERHRKHRQKLHQAQHAENRVGAAEIEDVPEEGGREHGVGHLGQEARRHIETYVDEPERLERRVACIGSARIHVFLAGRLGDCFGRGYMRSMGIIRSRGEP